MTEKQSLSFAASGPAAPVFATMLAIATDESRDSWKYEGVHKHWFNRVVYLASGVLLASNECEIIAVGLPCAYITWSGEIPTGDTLLEVTDHATTNKRAVTLALRPSDNQERLAGWRAFLDTMADLRAGRDNKFAHIPGRPQHPGYFSVDHKRLARLMAAFQSEFVDVRTYGPHCPVELSVGRAYREKDRPAVNVWAVLMPADMVGRDVDAGFVPYGGVK